MSEQHIDQLPLFDEPAGVASEPTSLPLSPSDQFRLDNPDFVEPTVLRSDWDPNARRVKLLRGVGGGIASAVAGEIVFTPESSPIVEPRTDRVLAPPPAHTAHQHTLSMDTRITGLNAIERLRSKYPSLRKTEDK